MEIYKAMTKKVLCILVREEDEKNPKEIENYFKNLL